MSLRDRILAEVSRARLPGATADQITDAITRHVDDELARSATIHLDGARQYADLLLAQRDGIDQGITRLALLDFLCGAPGSWNGERRIVGENPTAWVRYRGHQIDREISADGVEIRLVFVGAAGVASAAPFRCKPNSMKDALYIAGDLDQIIDDVYEAHGGPEPIVDAEVVELVDGATARRVLDAWQRWLFVQPIRAGQDTDAIVDLFAAAIDRDEVQP